MGIIKQGILGGFSKKVGSVVGTSWKGIAVMKSMPQSVVNPKTTLQVNQRNAFKQTAKFASLLLTPAIQECWNRWAKRESGYNAFIKANIAAMKAAGANALDFSENMILSNGELTLSGLAGSQSAEGDTITVTATWDKDELGGRYDKGTDIVKLGMILADVVDEDIDFSTAKVVYANAVARTAGTASVSFEGYTASTGYIPFIYVISADGYFRSENLNLIGKMS